MIGKTILNSNDWKKFFGKEIKIPKDNIIFPRMLKKRWGSVELAIISNYIDKNKDYDLIDIGANVGLISLILNDSFKIQNTICFEPDKINYDCLKHNLDGINCSIFNFGLGNKNETVVFYKDNLNNGNHSVYKNKELIKHGFTTTTVDIKTPEYAFNNINLKNSIIYKSDTQGNDVKIVNEMPDTIWKNVELAWLEIWLLDDNNMETFYEKLSQFKIFYHKNQEISLDKLKNVISNLKGKFTDIICAKRNYNQ